MVRFAVELFELGFKLRAYCAANLFKAFELYRVEHFPAPLSDEHHVRVKIINNAAAFAGIHETNACEMVVYLIFYSIL